MALPPLGPRRVNDQEPVPKADASAHRSRLALCRLSADTLKLGGAGAAGDSELGANVRVVVEEFRLRLLGPQARILPNQCSWVLQGLPTVGPTLPLSSRHEAQGVCRKIQVACPL